jgi:hypothetical protein
MPYTLEDNAYTMGLGVGLHFLFRPFYIDVDVSAKNVVSGPDVPGKYLDLVTYSGAVNRTFPSMRATLGLRLFDRLAVFCGATLDMQVPGMFGENLLNTGESFMLPVGRSEVSIYPKYFAGIRL